jgi:hypothetical protein
LTPRSARSPASRARERPSSGSPSSGRCATGRSTSAPTWGPRGPRKVIEPADIEKLRDPAKRLEAWRRLIAATVARATVEPATTADGRRPLAGDPGRVTVEFVLRQ